MTDEQWINETGGLNSFLNGYDAAPVEFTLSAPPTLERWRQPMLKSGFSGDQVEVILVSATELLEQPSAWQFALRMRSPLDGWLSA
jgi:hypothetical protein